MDDVKQVIEGAAATGSAIFIEAPIALATAGLKTAGDVATSTGDVLKSTVGTVGTGATMVATGTIGAVTKTTGALFSTGAGLFSKLTKK